MSLHNGLDTIAIISNGVYSKTYGSTGQKYICNLFASFGFLEDAPTGAFGRLLRGIIRMTMRK